MKIKLIVLYLSLASFIGSIGMESTAYAQDSKDSQAIGSSEKKSNKTDKKKSINKRRPSRKKYEGEAQLNARNINDPAFTGNGASLNSVMFESRPGRKVESLPPGPVRDSNVEFVGGKSMEIVVDGREIKTEDGQKR